MAPTKHPGIREVVWADGKRRTWQVVIKVGGKRTVETFQTLGEARVRRTAIDHGINVGTYVISGRETVEEYLGRWMADYAQVSLRPRTWERYEELLKGYVIPALGAHRLGQLRKPHIVAAEAAWTRGGMSPATLLKVHWLVRGALEKAVEWEVLAANPAVGIRPPSVPAKPMRVLDEDQCRAFLAALRGHPLEPLLVTALHTGMRLSELRGLTWSAVDFRAEEIRVVRGAHRVRGGGTRFEEPKTDRSRRAVAVDTQVLDLLRPHRGIGTALVFPGRDGEPVSENSIRWHFQEVLQRAGLPPLNLHGLRHSMASLMLAAGEHPKVVQERLGHSSIGTTMDTYSHVLPGLQQAAARRLGALLGGTVAEA